MVIRMSVRVETWLKNLGLSQYAEVFSENDVDERVLSMLSNEDLKEIGVSLGHRKIILAAIRELSVDPASDSPASEARTASSDRPVLRSGRLDRIDQPV